MNEIKVGQWCRYPQVRRDNKKRMWYLLQIKDFDFDDWNSEKDRIVFSHGRTCPMNRKGLKVHDNLVDLLEVGDIISLEWNDVFQTKDEYILTESLLKNLKSIYDYEKDYKITAIELHENRVKQVIKND